MTFAKPAYSLYSGGYWDSYDRKVDPYYEGHLANTHLSQKQTNSEIKEYNETFGLTDDPIEEEIGACEDAITIHLDELFEQFRDPQMQVYGIEETIKKIKTSIKDTEAKVDEFKASALLKQEQTYGIPD